MKTQKNVCDFTGRPINSADSRGYNFQSVSLEKQHVKGEIIRSVNVRELFLIWLLTEDTDIYIKCILKHRGKEDR